jgi:hypothetical protein
MDSKLNDENWNNLLGVIEEFLKLPNLTSKSQVYPKDYLKLWNKLKSKILSASEVNHNDEIDHFAASQGDLMDFETIESGNNQKNDEKPDLLFSKLNLVSKLISKFPEMDCSQTLSNMTSINLKIELQIIDCLSKFKDLKFKEKALERLSKIPLKNSSEKIKTLQILRDIGISSKGHPSKKTVFIASKELIVKLSNLFDTFNDECRLLLIGKIKLSERK